MNFWVSIMLHSSLELVERSWLRRQGLFPCKILNDRLIGPLIACYRAELSLDPTVVRPRCNRLSEKE